MGAPLCGECRLGLGVHQPLDPYCHLYVAPPVVGPPLYAQELDERGTE